MNRKPIAILSSVIALTLTLTSLFTGKTTATDVEILDPSGPVHPILSPLANALDQIGVDVILGRAASFKASQRARLTTLDGFESSKGRNWGGFWRDVWIDGFEKGLIGAVFATASNSEPPALTGKWSVAGLFQRLRKTLLATFYSIG